MLIYLTAALKTLPDLSFFCTPDSFSRFSFFIFRLPAINPFSFSIVMSHIVKKQEEQDLQKIRDLLRLSDNKRCFECATKSPFFVDMTIQTFVCARCSGLIREVGHRVKSISTSKFSGPETTSLEMGGNAMGKRIWLHGYGNNGSTSGGDDVIESDYDVRLFMRQKYYDQRWLDKALWKEHSEKMNKVVMELYTEDGIRRSGLPGGTRRLSSRIASPTTSNFALPPPPPPSSSTPTPIKYATSSLPKKETNHTTQDLFSLAVNTSTPTPASTQQELLFDNDESWMTSTISPSPTTTVNAPPLTDPFDNWIYKPSPINTKPNVTTMQPLAPSPSSLSSPMKLTSQQPSPSMTPPSSDPFAALRDLSF
ncbi:hypothetical protein BCR42DRAFT_422786 [Absidia repens]|uniref:Arf-GAP domain-containing protein n=1 Tax=Absidia repens TaxID=90262 RepID=A0A1X2I5Y6_9FUNG|nr:hypothetical protein BCR42DRAFT_422786 [Absidia repens]